jgi:prevent-host-death family protein
MTEVSLADARNRLSELITDVETTHARVTVTKHGRPAVVLISPDDLDLLRKPSTYCERLAHLRRSAKLKRRLPAVKPSTNGQSEPTSLDEAITPRVRDSRPVSG